MINRSSDITPEVAVAKRKELGLSMRGFWGYVHVSPSSASHYESGKTKGIPAPVQELVFLAYFVGIPMQRDLDGYTPIVKAIKGMKYEPQSKKLQALVDNFVSGAGKLGIELTPEQIKKLKSTDQ